MHLQEATGWTNFDYWHGWPLKLWIILMSIDQNLHWMQFRWFRLCSSSWRTLKCHFDPKSNMYIHISSLVWKKCSIQLQFQIHVRFSNSYSYLWTRKQFIISDNSPFSVQILISIRKFMDLMHLSTSKSKWFMLSKMIMLMTFVWFMISLIVKSKKS